MGQATFALLNAGQRAHFPPASSAVVTGMLGPGSSLGKAPSLDPELRVRRVVVTDHGKLAVTAIIILAVSPFSPIISEDHADYRFSMVTIADFAPGKGARRPTFVFLILITVNQPLW